LHAALSAAQVGTDTHIMYHGFTARHCESASQQPSSSLSAPHCAPSIAHVAGGGGGETGGDGGEVGVVWAFWHDENHSFVATQEYSASQHGVSSMTLSPFPEHWAFLAAHVG